MTIGEVLRKARIAAGIQQQVLAQTLNVSTSSYNRFEHNLRGWETEWLDKLPPVLRQVAADFLTKSYQQQLDAVKAVGAVADAELSQAKHAS